jgi:competence protein ComEA
LQGPARALLCRAGMRPLRSALLLLCLAALAPALLRRELLRPAPTRSCTPEGRGEPPRHWAGCAADGGARRELSGQERLVLGLPIDLNRASAADLEMVPGLSERLAAAVVADRAARGPFATAEELLRVRGIGPARLARALPHLTTPEPAGR